MSFLAPLFFVGLAALAVPVLVHLIQRERKDIVEFPSLMFLRKIPYQSVERRRIHNWLLLMLRAAAMALLVAAFARPFLFRNPLQAAGPANGAREIVILLDRSASMGYGDHWQKAQQAARKAVEGVGREDQATLILFGTGTEEAVRATSDRGRLQTAIDAATVSSEATRYAPALRWAQSHLTRSALPRKEVVFISDFQKTGWERQEEIHMPEGTVITPVSVATLETSGLAVASVSLQRSSFSNEERVTITAGLTNRGAAPFNNVPVTLEVDGRPVETKPISVGPNASGSVTFAQITASQPNMRATIRAGSDALPKDNAFHFVISPSRPVSVLIIQRDGTSAANDLFLQTALSISKTPPFKVDLVPVSRVTPANFERRSVVVLRDVTTLSSQTDASVKRFVEQGGGLFVVLAENSPWSGGDTPLLPGTLGAPVERLASGSSGTLGFLDYSHPVFDDFKDPRNGTFTGIRFYQYRTLNPAATDRVLARFDDGAAALVERRVGSGRVIAFTSTLDPSWTNFPQQIMFPVIVPGLLKYLGQYEEPSAWYTVGRMLDISVPLGAIVREGSAGDIKDTTRKASAVVVSPTGKQTTMGEGGSQTIELAEQGFYSIRMQGTGERRPYEVAVNLDPAESDLSALSPTDFLGNATGRPAAVVPGGGTLEKPNLTPADMEKKQSFWWFLLVGGVLALLAEALLANRLSRRFGAGLLQTGKT
jgi:aerotolerance regulator-like protein/VWA domain-containing protein